LRRTIGWHIIGSMERDEQQHRSRPTRIEVVLAAVVVVGVGLGLARVSLLNYGAIIAPALAGVLVLGVFGVRAIGPAGRARSMLTLVGGGLVLVGLLFLGAFALLWTALMNRGV
jgi:hypothetical protein